MDAEQAAFKIEGQCIDYGGCSFDRRDAAEIINEAIAARDAEIDELRAKLAAALAYIDLHTARARRIPART